MEPVADAEAVPEVGGEDTAPVGDAAAGVDEGVAAAPAPETTEPHAGDTEVVPPGEEVTQVAGDLEGAAAEGGPGEDGGAEPAAATTTRYAPLNAPLVACVASSALCAPRAVVREAWWHTAAWILR
jgi:hypothetical protein